MVLIAHVEEPLRENALHGRAEDVHGKDDDGDDKRIWKCLAEDENQHGLRDQGQKLRTLEEDETFVGVDGGDIDGVVEGNDRVYREDAKHHAALINLSRSERAGIHGSEDRNYRRDHKHGQNGESPVQSLGDGQRIFHHTLVALRLIHAVVASHTCGKDAVDGHHVRHDRANGLVETVFVLPNNGKQKGNVEKVDDDLRERVSI